MSSRLLLAAEDLAILAGEADVLAGEGVLVVVPGDDLDVVEPILVGEDDGLGRVEDRAIGRADDVAGDDLIGGVAEDALEVALAGFLERGVDAVDGQILIVEDEGEVD